MPCCFEYYDEDFSEYESCQFDMGEEELIQFKNNDYCLFHLPVSDKGNQKGKLTYSEKYNCSQEYVDSFNEKLIKYLDETCQLNEVESRTDYTGIIFPGKISFDNKVLDGFDFRYCKFYGRAQFVATIFTVSSEFSNVEFYESVSFFNAKFSAPVIFDNTIFHGDFHISYSGNNHDIERVIREESERDNKEVTSEDIDEKLKSIALLPGGSFEHCCFKKEVSFQNRIITSGLSFKGAVFYRAPKFYNCVLHQETYFPSYKNFEDTNSEDAFHRYRVLKLAMENVRNRSDEAGFFTLEQRSLRSNKPWYKNYFSFSYLYDITSEYGINAARTLLWLFFVITGFGVLYSKASSHDYPKNILIGFENAITNVLRPFQVWRSSESASLAELYSVEPLLLLKIAMSMQSIVCLSLLAVFIISIRWRFKRG